jgi:hypothetical protein
MMVAIPSRTLGMVGTVAVGLLAHEFGRQRGHLVLSCIASIGKGLRSEGEVIDIEQFFLAFVPFPGHYASTG